MYVDVNAVADHFSVTPQTVNNWRKKDPDNFPYLPIGEDGYRYSIEDIENYWKERRKKWN